MGGAQEGTKTTMEVDSIVAKVAIESIQVAPDTTEATTKIMHPFTLSTITEIEEGTKDLQPRDGIGDTMMVKQIVFWQKQDNFT